MSQSFEQTGVIGKVIMGPFVVTFQDIMQVKNLGRLNLEKIAAVNGFAEVTTLLPDGKRNGITGDGCTMKSCLPVTSIDQIL
jgi:hypothetical protein